MPSRRTCLSLLIAVMISVGGGAGVARADQDVSRLMREAEVLFARGAFSRSRLLLERAAAVARTQKLQSRISLQLGLNFAAEENTSAARRAFAHALRLDPSVQMDTQRFKPSVVELFERERRRMVGTLVVNVDPPGGVLWIDGALAGGLPFEGRLRAGSHALRVQRGDMIQRRRFEIRGGETTRLLLVASPQPTSSQPSRAHATRATPLPSSRPATGRATRLWAWVAAAGAVASVGVAIGLGLSAMSDREQACDLTGPPGLSCDARTEVLLADDLGRYNDLRAAIADKALGANIAWGVAGALAITSALLFFWPDGTPEQAESRRQDQSLLRIVPLGGVLTLRF